MSSSYLALSRLLDAHTGSRLHVWFDHHDDLVFVGDRRRTSVVLPGRLTQGVVAGAFAKRPSDNPRSIVGKAYYNVDLFSGRSAQTIV
jgi:hypothetical protein